MDVLKVKNDKDIRVVMVEGSFEEPLSNENFRISQCFGFD